MVREGLRALLLDSDSIQVVGETADGQELLHLLQTTPADVVLMDMNMPGKNGLETTTEMKQAFPHVKVLVLSMLDHERHVAQMIEAGAAGYILKNAGKEELVSAIQLVAAGVPYISSEITIDLLKKTPVPGRHESPPAEKSKCDLTRRELEILALIAEGHTNAEISEMLFTSKRTIETHRQNLLEKTQTNNTATLIKYAFKNGLLS